MSNNNDRKKEEVEFLSKFIGKTIKSFQYTFQGNILNLHSIKFEDGSEMTLYASDYDNIVMVS